ncbi:hypothetical protein ACFFVB_12305 [Formosa undariae]|uniref:DUF4440 domain-containing protein n=1 Tax=Formosa undariae TaxID=1325436 RepID=A0ABV5F356_9FLAO
MKLENLQTQLADCITEQHAVWSNLLANTNYGNYASSLWNVTLKPEDITVNRDDETFTFQHANFEFDVEVGLSFGDDNTMFSKLVSGQGTFQISNHKTIEIKTLILNKDFSKHNK